MSRDPAWSGTNWAMTNMTEFKSGQRMLIEGNIYENSFNSWTSQIVNPVYSLEFAATNGNGASNNNSWNFVGDVTVRNNIFRHVALGIGVTRWIVLDPPYYPQPSARFWIHDNLFYDVHGGGGSSGDAFYPFSGPLDVTIEHNTVDQSASPIWGTAQGNSADNFIFRNNLIKNAG
jgi:hypothetical protein